MDDEAPHAGNGSVPPEVRGIVDLMNRVEREEPVERDRLTARQDAKRHQD